MNKKGFTLIEVIVVVAILGILAGVAVVAFGGIHIKSQKNACFANIKNVETAAWANATIYDENVPTVANTILSGDDTYYTNDVTCPSGGVYSARYDEETGRLIISCSVHGEISASQTNGSVEGAYRLEFSSPDFNIDDYLHASHYRIEDGKLKSSYGLFMADVEPSEHYMVETTATLSGNGGYGILIGTRSEDASHDHGYSVQFDKSYNKSIIIRERENGQESSPIMIRELSNFIPEAQDESWWNEEHMFAVEVNSVSDSQSALNIFVDGVLVGKNDYTMLIDSTEGANMIGLRSWNSTTEYNYLDYKDMD